MGICDEAHAAEAEHERNVYFAFLKIVAAIFVVYIHSWNIVGYAGLEPPPRVMLPIRTLVGTANPIFFIVSAYLLFSKPFDWSKNAAKKCRGLLVPYLCWSLFYIAFEFVGHMIYPSAFDDISAWGLSDWVVTAFGVPFVKGPIYAPLWFMRDLFIINLFAPAILWLLEKAPVPALAGGGTALVRTFSW